MVTFNQIQPNWKIPGVSVELDPSQAGTPVNIRYALLVGYKTAAGTAAADVPIAVGTQSDANTLFGRGSMLARMFTRFFEINKSTPLYALPIVEPGAGVAATGTILVAGAPTAAGTLSLYIAGQLVEVGINSTDTTANVATAINAAINAALDLPVTATVGSSTVTLTSRHKGISGNDIRMETNYRGFFGGEALPAGLALTISGSGFLASGTGNPTLPTAISNIGDAPYKIVGLPFNDSGSYALFDTEYGMTDSGRWGWLRQAYGQVFSARRDTYSNLITYGPSENYAVIHAMAVETPSPTPIWEWTAAYAARAAASFSIHAARPLQFLQLSGVLPAPRANRFNKTQLNALALVGLTIQGTDLEGVDLGTPMILREQSRYQKNTQGVSDNAYELATTLATLDEIITTMRQRITNKYPRHMLANDGTRFGTNAVVTPNIMKGEIIAIYRELESRAFVENARLFKKYLVVERSDTDPNALDVSFPPDIINQLRRTNVQCSFRLQFSATDSAIAA